METQNNIYVIAYEGANRSGKGTQIALMSQLLSDCSLPHIVIRGDGSRPGEGVTPGDPRSIWWQEVNTYLRNPDTDKNVWNMTSYRLARELIIWRERVLPGILNQFGSNTGFLLVDRSLLSRTLVPREILSDMNPDHVELYSPDMRPDGVLGKKGRIVSVPDVVPDILFELIVPKEELLARFDDSDPKNVWRRWLVEERYDWYLNSTDHIPVEYRDRVVKIDANRSPQEILRDIIYNINSKFNLNINSNG